MRSFVFLFVVFALISSCKKDYTISKIDSDVIVSVSRVNGSIQLKGQTERIYSNSGWEVINCFKVRKNKIYAEFKKMKHHNISFAAFSPGQCYIDLGNLSSGTYEVTFCLNKQKTKGKLVVADEIQLELENGNVKVE